MYLTSGAFDQTIRKSGRTFHARLTCGNECIEGGFTNIGVYGGSNSADTITIGSTISQRIEVEMQETNIALSEKEWLLEIGLLVKGILPGDNKYPSDDWLIGEVTEELKSSEVEFFEYVPVGYFTPEKPTTDNGKTTFNAYDRMMKLSGAYTCLLDKVTTLTVLNDISEKTGVPINTTGLKEISISEPEGYTYREVVMYIAQLYGKFVNISRKGILEFHWWTEVKNYEISPDNTNGFKHNETEFVLEYLYAAHTDKEGQTVSMSAGDGKQGISVLNPFMTQNVLDTIFDSIKGFSYTVSDVNCILGDIRLDPWDVVSVIDVKGSAYKVPIMSLEFKYDGGLSAKFSAVGNSETEDEVDYKGPMQLLQERLVAKTEETARRLETQITQTAAEIELMAKKDEIIALINLSAELARIKAAKIALEGAVTVNENVKILEDGTLSAKNGVFEGKVVSNSAEITGGTINIDTANSNDQIIKLNAGDYFSFLCPDSIYFYDNYCDTALTAGVISISGSSNESIVLLGVGGHDIIKCNVLSIDGNLNVNGTKSRLAKTKSYNERLLYCYEMPSPVFGDMGHGTIGEDGFCYIDIDPVFFETIDTKQSYHVFLQSYSENQVCVAERQQGHFVVKGTPNTEFDWEIKAKQLDFPMERLEEQLPEDDYKEPDYVALASEYLRGYEQEVLSYE